jgi:hypothetical protein
MIALAKHARMHIDRSIVFCDGSRGENSHKGALHLGRQQNNFDGSACASWALQSTAAYIALTTDSLSEPCNQDSFPRDCL